VSDLHPPSHPRPPLPYALVVDDHPLVGRGVAEYLKGHTLLGDAMVASHADEVLALIDKLGPPTVLLVDFWLSEGATDRLISLVRSRWPDIKVLVMSGDDNPAIVTKALACGAHGFLHKQEAPQVFSDAVSAVLAGQTWYGTNSASMADALGAPRNARSVTVTPADLGLTARQGQILSMLLQALPNKRIADELSVSENTVKEHVTAILQKLSVGNRVELITKLRGMTLEQGVFE
jgi:DNA-binding NarL/FixJ family response regulator